MLLMSRSASRICWPTAYMGTVPRGRGQALSMPSRMASRSPAMDRSMTVSAPASRAALILRFSVSGQLQSGDVPRLALTLIREGWPTRMGLSPSWAGLPRSTMLPSSRALVMASGARPSSWARAARCRSSRPRRAAFFEQSEDDMSASRVATQGAKKATTCGESGCGCSFPPAVRTASGSQGLGLIPHSQPPWTCFRKTHPARLP